MKSRNTVKIAYWSLKEDSVEELVKNDCFKHYPILSSVELTEAHGEEVPQQLPPPQHDPHERLNLSHLDVSTLP
uniref:Uncharacterized protein n=1 Tax=Panagrolaimus sp. JU765 TaxID=591449 RepID=A0AC34QIT0_9BILA